VGNFKHRDRAGKNAFLFTGRVNGRALAPGHYELVAAARLRNKLANAVVSAFTIVRC
jgi:hypothetical protein